MDIEQNNNNFSNLPESSKSKKDIIVELKPEGIKKDILFFKEEVLQEIKLLEKNLFQKNQESNEFIKNKISSYDIKIKILKDTINSLSNQVIDGIKNEEKLNSLYQSRQILLDATGSNKIKISLLERETRDSINRVNETLKQSIFYPGVIGNNGKFKNFHEFIDFLLNESNANSTFRHKNIMDLSSFKMKIDKSIQTMSFKIESNLLSNNSYTERKVKEIEDKFEDIILRYKKNLNDLRIENSDYVIKLERDTKDLRSETNIIKNMRKDIFDKIDTEVMNMKKENEKIIEMFQEFKSEVELIKNDINRIDKKIEELIVEKIGILFDGQKEANVNIENFNKKFNEHKNVYNKEIKEIKKNIEEEQNLLVNSIGEINDKLNSICGKVLYTNNTNHENKNDNNYIYNDKGAINNNIGLSKEKLSANYTTNIGKINTFSNRNIKVKTFQGNNNMAHIVNINRIGLISSQKRREIEKDPYYNSNNNIITPNYMSRSDNNNNILSDKKLLETLKISKIQKVGKTNSNQYKQNNINNNNRNETISPEIKKDNLHLIKNKKPNPSFSPQSLNPNIKNNANINQNMNTKKFSTIYRIKTALNEKDKLKIEEEKDLDYEGYAKFFNLKKNRKIKRRSLNNEKIQTLQNFQKILKININDVDAKLNDFNNVSTASFKILKDNKEIYDRFFLSNSTNDVKLGIKSAFNKNTNTNDNNNQNRNIHRINLLNVNSIGNQSEKNSIEDHSSTKNMMEAKTSSYFYHLDLNKKIEKEYIARPDSHNILKLKRNNKIGLVRNPNSEIMNLKVASRNKPLGTNSLSRYHNYFIGFFDNENDNKKKKKTKIKYKSLNNKKFNDEIKDTNINSNKNNIRKIKGIFGNKNS